MKSQRPAQHPIFNDVGTIPLRRILQVIGADIQEVPLFAEQPLCHRFGRPISTKEFRYLLRTSARGTPNLYYCRGNTVIYRLMGTNVFID